MWKNAPDLLGPGALTMASRNIRTLYCNKEGEQVGVSVILVLNAYYHISNTTLIAGYQTLLLSVSNYSL